MWYEPDCAEAEFWAWSDTVTRDAAGERAKAEAALTVYFGSEFSFTGSSTFDAWSSLIWGDDRPMLDPIGYNLVASVTDTMAGHLLRNKVRPQFVTEKGSVQQKNNAKGMQRGVEGEFHSAQMYSRRARDVCFRGLILKGGGVKAVADKENERVDFQTVWPHEFFVPRSEETRDCVRQMVHQYDVDRAVLKRTFPEHADAIQKADPFTGNDAPGEREVTDRVQVREAWHLPSVNVDKHPDDHDGRRVLAIKGTILVSEPWEHDYFPVAWFLPMVAQGTSWSRGYPERLAGAQQKLNEYQDRIDQILNLHARPLLIAWARAGINRSKITNALANILVSKVPPSQALWQMTPQAVPRELVERVQAIIAWGEKQAGVSELSISAQKPAGIEHAPALRYLSDAEAVRHTMVFGAWEQFYLDLAKIVVGCLRELALANSDYTTLFSDNRELEAVKWKDVDLGKNKYHLTCWPTNLLPQTPSARIATLIEMTQNDLITPRDAMSRFENPDVKDLLGDQSAADENVERLMRDAAEGKPNAVPHAYYDLALLQVKLKERINRLEADGEDEQVIDRMVTLFKAARQLELKTMAEQNLASGVGGVAGIQSVAGMPPAGAAAPPAPAPAPAAPPAL